MTYKWDEMTKFERDKLVAEKCEGKWNVQELIGGERRCDSFNVYGEIVNYPLLDYSDCCFHAFRLLDDFWEWRIVNSTTRGFLCYGITHKKHEYRGEGNILAEAICKCSLLSVGVDIE